MNDETLEQIAPTVKLAEYILYTGGIGCVSFLNCTHLEAHLTECSTHSFAYVLESVPHTG